MDGFGLQPNRPAMAAEHPRRVDLRQLVDWLPEAAPRGLDFPFYIRRHFNRVWVPGEPQLPFARKLGFSDEHTATGFYCADPEPFLKVWEARKNRDPAKKLLYIGRYLPVKGVQELWSAFASLSDDFPEWELHCIGTGDLWDERMIHPKIVHHGFLQPHELTPHLIDAAAFVMPSKKEPWGVVLHEMAIAGLPLLAAVRSELLRSSSTQQKTARS